MKTQFGIVCLLDALGARSASIATSQAYLRALKHLRKEIHGTLAVTLPDDPKKRADARLLAQLRPRFFGDSILMTYAVRSPRSFDDYFSRMTFTLIALVTEALNKGVLFRGAIAIGDYIESSDVVLGPAIVDAANWYDKLDQVGIMCTPAATTYLKAEFTNDSDTFNEERPGNWLVLYDAPINNGGTVRTYLLNWPDCAAGIHCATAEESPLKWFYRRLRTVPTPPGTESKHQNTEAFFRKQIIYFNAQKKADHRTQASSARGKPPR